LSDDPIGDVGRAAHALGEALDALWGPRDEPLGLDDLSGLLLLLQDLQKEVGQHTASTEATIVNLMKEKTIQTPYGTFEKVTSSSKQTWDTPMVLHALAREALDRRDVLDSGEIKTPAEVIVKAVLDCASVNYFRLGELERYGIDGREYRQVEWGRKRLKISRIQPSQDPPEEVPSQP
jgi:hypothetical protein